MDGFLWGIEINGSGRELLLARRAADAFRRSIFRRRNIRMALAVAVVEIKLEGNNLGKDRTIGYKADGSDDITWFQLIGSFNGKMVNGKPVACKAKEANSRNLYLMLRPLNRSTPVVCRPFSKPTQWYERLKVWSSSGRKEN